MGIRQAGIHVYAVELNGTMKEFVSFVQCMRHYDINDSRHLGQFNGYSIIRDGTLIAKVFKDRMAAFSLSRTIKNNIV